MYCETDAMVGGRGPLFMCFRAGAQEVRKVCVRGWMQAAGVWSRGLDLVCTTFSEKVARPVRMEIRAVVTLYSYRQIKQQLYELGEKDTQSMLPNVWLGPLLTYKRRGRKFCD